MDEKYDVIVLGTGLKVSVPDAPYYSLLALQIVYLTLGFG